jgi:hypothetical protein
MAEVSPAADEAPMDEWGDVEAVRRLNEDDIRKIHAKNRRWWGTTIALVVILLGVFFVVGLVFLLWLWSIVQDSPTIS